MESEIPPNEDSVDDQLRRADQWILFAVIAVPLILSGYVLDVVFWVWAWMPSVQIGLSDLVNSFAAVTLIFSVWIAPFGIRQIWKILCLIALVALFEVMRYTLASSLGMLRTEILSEFAFMFAVQLAVAYLARTYVGFRFVKQEGGKFPNRRPLGIADLMILVTLTAVSCAVLRYMGPHFLTYQFFGSIGYTITYIGAVIATNLLLVAALLIARKWHVIVMFAVVVLVHFFACWLTDAILAKAYLSESPIFSVVLPSYLERWPSHLRRAFIAGIGALLAFYVLRWRGYQIARLKRSTAEPTSA